MGFSDDMARYPQDFAQILDILGDTGKEEFVMPFETKKAAEARRFRWWGFSRALRKSAAEGSPRAAKLLATYNKYEFLVRDEPPRIIMRARWTQEARENFVAKLMAEVSGAPTAQTPELAPAESRVLTTEEALRALGISPEMAAATKPPAEDTEEPSSHESVLARLGYAPRR